MLQKRVLRYLKGNTEFTLHLKASPTLTLEGFFMHHLLILLKIEYPLVDTVCSLVKA